MFGEDDIKRLKRQEWEAFGQVGKDDAKAIKAAKADERANARAERAWEKTQERGWKAIERAERYNARERWKQEQADYYAQQTTVKQARKEAKAAKAAAREWEEVSWKKRRPAKESWQEPPAKGWKNSPAPGWDAYPDDAKRRWVSDEDYYGEPAPAGCWLVAFSVPGFAAFTLLVLVALFLLAQVAANR